MTSKARRIVGWLFLIVLNVQTILFGPLIIQNLKDTERAISLREPTVTDLARRDYVDRRRQELVILVVLTAISFTMNLIGGTILLKAKRIEW
jgi:hypothetical protein